MSTLSKCSDTGIFILYVYAKQMFSVAIRLSIRSCQRDKWRSPISYKSEEAPVARCTVKTQKLDYPTPRVYLCPLCKSIIRLSHSSQSPNQDNRGIPNLRCNRARVGGNDFP